MNTIKKLFAGLFKAGWLTIVILILAPIPFFAWRMDQPLRYKEFNGLNYYQYQGWLSMEYQINTDSGKYKKDQCKNQDILYKTFALTFTPTQSFISAIDGLLGKSNPARGLIDFLPDDYYAHANYKSVDGPHSGVTVNTTVWNFLPKWWNAYEFLFWYTSNPQNFLDPFCPIRAPIPSPEQYQAMKQAAQQASVVK